MLETIMRNLRNWFLQDAYSGEYVVHNGSIDLPFMKTGQYFRIVGSTLNDGVYRYPATGLVDEVFVGSVWALAIPKAFLDAVAEIEAWQEKHGDAAAGPYQSESFGGYTYTKATDEKTGGAATWETTFRGRLNAWRKI